MTNREKAKRVEDMLETLSEHIAIDAKYYRKRDFYYKVYGQLEATIHAITWMSDLPSPMLSYYKDELHRMREDLETWYYRIEI